MPCPGCSCTESKKYLEHFEYQRLLQFLMCLNESCSQSSNQIMMMFPTPSINKAYPMIISEKSRRFMASSSDVVEGTTMFSGKGNSHIRNSHQNTSYRSKKNDLYCDYCHLIGHTKTICYKLIGYPPDYKFKKKVGPHITGSHANDNESSKVNYVGKNPYYVGNTWSYDTSNSNTSSEPGPSHIPRRQYQATDAFGDISQFTEQQYNQILTMLDSETPAVHSAMTAGMIPYTTVTEDEVKWIVDSGASSHMVKSATLLSHTKAVNKTGLGKVHLPTGSMVTDLSSGKVKGIGRKDNGLYVFTTGYNTSMAGLLKSLGIVHQSSCVYTLQQNGVAE
ncbi:hypothetical protein KY289_036906 [Solanum tuberosum]|nr:hypothetical protein KY289_036906 [Solanum tuberosum]